MPSSNSSTTYKGISFPFRFGSTGGVVTSVLSHDDFSRIRESLTQIIFTTFNERVMNNDFGSKSRDHVFENLDDVTDQSILRHDIQNAIAKWEDRVEINTINIYTNPDEEGKLFVDVDCLIVKYNKDVTVTVASTTNS